MTDRNTTESRRGKWILRIIATVAVVGWMAAIYLFSADDADTSQKKSDEVVEKVIEVAVETKVVKKERVNKTMREKLSFLVRKSGHMLEYALLGVLTVLACAAWDVRRLHVRALISFVIAVLYAAADEYHQTGVSGRSGEIRDVLIDAGGAALGIGICIFVMWCIRRKMRRKAAKSAENPA